MRYGITQNPYLPYTRIEAKKSFTCVKRLIYDFAFSGKGADVENNRHILAKTQNPSMQMLKYNICIRGKAAFDSKRCCETVLSDGRKAGYDAIVSKASYT